jgi:hypothetical protein
VLQPRLAAQIGPQGKSPPAPARAEASFQAKLERVLLLIRGKITAKREEPTFAE